MKKLWMFGAALLMLVITVSCKDDEKTLPTFQFDQVEVADVTAVSARVSCHLVGDANLTDAGTVGFAYGTAAMDVADYTYVPSLTVTNNTAEVRLAELDPETDYRVFCYVDLVGGSRMTSVAKSFATLMVDENTPVIDITGKKTIVATVEGGSYSTTCEIVNPTPSGALTAETESAWVHTFDYTAGSFSCVVDPNQGDERTAIVTLLYPGAQSRMLTVIQEAKIPDQPTEETVITLTRNNDWPESYQSVTKKLGDYEYYLIDAAIYNSESGIQFRSDKGYIANKADMGRIHKIELVYSPKDNNQNFVLYLGDAEKPTAQMVSSQMINGVNTFDCAGYSYHYFKLINGAGAGYLYEIKIYIGDGGQPSPDNEPSFTNLASSQVTKNSATLNCQFTYTGSKTVTEAGFRYKTLSGNEMPAPTTVATGAKSAALTLLSPATTYSYYFYTVIDGKTFKSGVGSFTTNNENDTPSSSDTYRSGWAELPAKLEKSGDYYYAYHLRADKKSVRNYSVCYSKELGCPVWVAAPMHACYKGSANRTDAYGQDPDLGCSQVGRRSGYTRGHMLGSSDRLVSTATNKQVFYYSNIGPQLQAGFNTGGGVWNNLEDFVDSKWCADTLYQVIGCYWANKNKKVDGTVIPTHYYKLLLRTKKGNSGKWVSNCSASELQCAAFIVEHRDQKGLKPNREMMKSVAELEQMTGFTFFANVPNAPKTECNPSDWGL
ncbi:MAG: DNA/RNA non-specific endonuclease [Alistipes sp.]